MEQTEQKYIIKGDHMFHLSGFGKAVGLLILSSGDLDDLGL